MDAGRSRSHAHHADRSKRWTTHVERSSSVKARREVVQSRRPQSSGGAPSGKVVAAADSAAYDEYVHNLQQQIYFLELESQLLKQQSEATTATTGTQQQGVTAAVTSSTPARGTPQEAAGSTSGGLTQSAPAAPAFTTGPPGEASEFEDIFTEFKHRYSTMEQKYQSEAESNRRAIESLRTQLEAHGSLVVRLQSELTRTTELHDSEREAWREEYEALSTERTTTSMQCGRQEEALAALRAEMDDFAGRSATQVDNLKDTVASLRAELEEASERATAQDASLADVEHQLKRREDEIVVLQRQLQEAEAKAPPLEAAVQTLTAERDEATAAQRTAELQRKATESAMQRLEAETAAVVQRLGEAEGDIQRLESQLSRTATSAEHHAMAREEAEVRLLLTSQQAEDADRARRVADSTSAAAKQRAADVTRELTVTVSTVERLNVALDAQSRKSQAVGEDLGRLSGALAEAQARGDALELEVKHAATRESALTQQLESEAQMRVAVEAELESAKRELMGKPDTAPLQNIDFNGLLQKNIEAATTIEAFIKESKEKEAKVAAEQADLASPKAVRARKNAGATASAAIFRRATVTTRRSVDTGAEAAASAPLAESPMRSSLPASQARAQLVGHTRTGDSSKTARHTSSQGWS